MKDDEPSPIKPLPRDFKLFGDHPEWTGNASLRIREKDWGAYAEGYKLAADGLVQRIREEQADAIVDFLVYPIAFLYRHYVELRLKQILKRGGYLAEYTPTFRARHELLPLWREAQEVINRIWPPRSAEHRMILEGTERVIGQLDQMDPTSYAFRYPVTKDDKQNLEELRGLNVYRLAEGIAYASQILDGSCYGIEEESQTKAEMENEARADVGQEYSEPEYDGDYERED